MKLFKKAIAELIGTFVLVAFACGTACAVTAWGGDTLDLAAKDAVIALSFGLCIVAMAYSVGNTSGCHINPAVSFGVLIYNFMQPKDKRTFHFVDFLVYIVAQVAGAFLGCGFLYLIFGANCGFAANQVSSVITSVNPDYPEIIGLVVEAVLTFVFVFTILGVTTQSKYQKCAGIVIGLTLTLVHLIGIPLTNTSVNPARSIAPAVFSYIFGGNATPLNQLWIFIAGPLLGAIIAAILYWIIAPREKELVKEEVAPVAKEEKPAKKVEAPAKEEKPAKKAAAPKKEAKKPEVKEETDNSKSLNIERVSFETKFKKADKDLKSKYYAIKEAVEAYGVKSRVSFEGDTFRLHKVAYCFMTIRGKTLKVYYKLNPKDFKDSTVPLKDESKVKKYAEYPAVLKVKSELSLKRALQLVDETMQKAKISKPETK